MAGGSPAEVARNCGKGGFRRRGGRGEKQESRLVPVNEGGNSQAPLVRPAAAIAAGIPVHPTKYGIFHLALCAGVSKSGPRQKFRDDSLF